MTPQERAELSLVVAQALGKNAKLNDNDPPDVTLWLESEWTVDDPFERTYLGTFDPTVPGADFSEALLWLRKDHDVALSHAGHNDAVIIDVYAQDVFAVALVHLDADSDPLAVCLAIKELKGD